MKITSCHLRRTVITACVGSVAALVLGGCGATESSDSTPTPHPATHSTVKDPEPTSTYNDVWPEQDQDDYDDFQQQLDELEAEEGDLPDDPSTTDDHTLSPQDWDDICVGGSLCDPVTGLPPFVPGGGLASEL